MKADALPALIKLLDQSKKAAPKAFAKELAAVTGLTNCEAELPSLLNACKDRYLLFLEAFNARLTPPARPSNRPKTNSTLRDWALRRDEEDWHLYGEDWDALFPLTQKGKGGNRKRPNGPPTEPLYHVHRLLELWYANVLGRAFTPEYVIEKMGAPQERLPAILNAANEPARMFYFVARYINADYVPENCNSVVDGVKRSRKSDTGKAALREKNRKAQAAYRLRHRASSKK